MDHSNISNTTQPYTFDMFISLYIYIYVYIFHNIHMTVLMLYVHESYHLLCKNHLSESSETDYSLYTD